MTRQLYLVLLLAGLALVFCGGKDWMAVLRNDYPGAAEYVAWKKYALVRYAPDSEDESQRAVLLQRSGEEWTELGTDDDGFHSLHVVMTYIPELDESGVEAFDLR